MAPKKNNGPPSNEQLRAKSAAQQKKAENKPVKSDDAHVRTGASTAVTADPTKVKTGGSPLRTTPTTAPSLRKTSSSASLNTDAGADGGTKRGASPAPKDRNTSIVKADPRVKTKGSGSGETGAPPKDKGPSKKDPARSGNAGNDGQRDKGGNGGGSGGSGNDGSGDNPGAQGNQITVSVRPKKLNICMAGIDGTGQSANSHSNVWWMVELFRLLMGSSKKAHYVKGPAGDLLEVESKLEKAKEGGKAALGTDVDDRMREAFKKLSLSYEKGDRLVIYGFSRGAFAAYGVECFSAWLGGLLHPDCLQNDDILNELFAEWEASNASPPQQDDLKRWEARGVKIVKTGAFKLVGLWDPVNAIADPLKPFEDRFKFLDSDVKGMAENYIVLLSRHEHRHKFRAIPIATCPLGSEAWNVWLDGVHIEIGGGGKRAGLDRISLACMIEYTMRVLEITFDITSIVAELNNPESQTWDYEANPAWANAGQTWRIPAYDFIRKGELVQRFEKNSRVTHCLHPTVRISRSNVPTKRLNDPPPYKLEMVSPDVDGGKVEQVFKTYDPAKGGKRKMKLETPEKKDYDIKERAMNKNEATTLSKLCQGIANVSGAKVKGLRDGIKYLMSVCTV